MHPGVAQCCNCWHWGHPTHTCHAQGAKCQKCNGPHRVENHRLLAWCCKANPKSNLSKKATVAGVLCPHTFFFCSTIYYTVFNCSLQQTIYNKQPTVLEISEDRNTLHKQIGILLQSEEIKNEIQIKIAHSQPTNYVSKSKETYYTKNTKLKETEKKRLRNYLQNQKSKTIEHSWRLRGRKRSFLRREGKCTWMLLQEINKVLN